MDRFSKLIAAVGFAMLAGSAQAVPPSLPDGVLIHDLSEDQIVDEFFADDETLVREATFLIHYGGVLTGLATYEGRYTINVVDMSVCLDGVGTFSGTFDGEPLEAPIELFGEGMCGSLATGLVAGAAKLGDSATVFLKCGQNPLDPNQAVCTYDLRGKI
jgi:hypothetical protein